MTTQSKPNALKRKAGPLPVWAWAALAAVAGYWFFSMRSSAATSTPIPVTQNTSGHDSGAQAPSGGGGGGGGPIDDGMTPLLKQIFGAQAGVIDSATAALVGGQQQAAAAAAAPDAPIIDAAAPQAAPVDNSSTFGNGVPGEISPSQSFVVVPSESPADPPQIAKPVTWFQNEEGYQTITTPTVATDYQTALATAAKTPTAPVAN